MRFTEPDKFLFTAIRLGLYRPSEPQSTFVGAAAGTEWKFRDISICKPRGRILCRWVSSDLRPAFRRRLVMQIYGPAQLHGTQAINAPHFNRTSAPAATNTPASINTTDELQLSPAAELAGKLGDIPDIRWDRVNTIKAAIADGTYMTDDKMNGALDRLLDEIA
jgi:negative regulator of flagellin synthesis FlgM